MLTNQPISIRTIATHFSKAISINFTLTLFETALTALIPLFIGFAIDGLLNSSNTELFQLVSIFALLIIISVARRLYDTRAYGHIRVSVTDTIALRAKKMPISKLNARLQMGRELVDFLEQEVPEIFNAVVQLAIALIVLYFLNPMLAAAGLISAFIMLLIYSLFHQGFYTLNSIHNQQSEKQVSVLETQSRASLMHHFNRLKSVEIKLSDKESILYGSIFIVLLTFVVFNLWYATLQINITAGTIFSIVSYSWEFISAALVLPITLQGWSRLSEIIVRINKPAHNG